MIAVIHDPAVAMSVTRLACGLDARKLAVAS